MSADFIGELANESLLALADYQHVCYGGRQGDLRSGHDSVGVRHVIGLTFRWGKLNTLDVLQSLADDIDTCAGTSMLQHPHRSRTSQTFAHCTDSLTMAKRLPDPMDHASVLLQRLSRFGTRGNEQRVEQCTPLSFEMVVRHDGGCPGRTRDLAPPRSNDERRGSSQLHRSPQSFDNIRLETVRDEDRDPPRLDQRLLRHEFCLRDMFGLLPVGLAVWFWRRVASDVDGDCLGQLVVDLVHLGDSAIVDDGVVAMTELERKGIDQVLLLRRRE